MKNNGQASVPPLAEIPEDFMKNLYHNGVRVSDYPSSRWSFVAFPAEKGTPFNADNLATVNNHSFINNPEFLVSKRVAEGRWPAVSRRDISWRLHIFLWAAKTAITQFPSSSFIELGTGRGYMAAAFCSSKSERPTKFFLADKFTGGGTDSVDSPGGNSLFMYSNDVSEVAQFFSQWDWVSLIEGELPKSLDGMELGPLSFVHCDMNFPNMEFATVQEIQRFLLPGALVLFDDTGFPGQEDSLKAHQRWADDSGSQLLMLPTGQSLVIYSGHS